MELPDMAWENHQLKIYFYLYLLILNSSKSPTFLNHKTKRIDELIATEQRKIELLKEYRQSLISEAVTGKIDVRNEV